MPVNLNDRYALALARVLRAPDPVAALAQLCADPETAPDLRAVLAQVEGDGLRMSALLILQLRFHRLLNGSPQASAAFAEDPARFSRQFQRYHAEVEPHAENPVQEAAAYADWCAAGEGRR